MLSEGLIGEITPWSDAATCSFRLHDLNNDGFDEVFEIIEVETGKTLEGYLVIGTSLEPIPDRMFINSEGTTKLDIRALASYISKPNE